jgi:phospholipase/carboxylesterase
MPALSLQNYVGCAPRGPITSNRSNNRFVWGQSVAATAVAEEIVFESIENVSRTFSIHSRRIFLAGFGSGATMAARIGLRYPELFAGVIPICGQFPNEQFALSKIGKARTLPILWMYGENSERHGVQHVCQTLPVLHAAGLTLDIRQYPCGDELLANMLSDANHWMMQLVTNQPCVENTASADTFSVN